MMESLPKMVDERIKKILQTQVPLHVAQGIILKREKRMREFSIKEFSSQVNDAITNHIPSQVDSSVRSYMSGHVLHVHPTQATSTTAQEQHQLYLTMKDNPQLQHDDLPIWLALKGGENSEKRQKTSEHGIFVFQESSSGQDYESKPGPSTLGNQEQSDEFDFWTNSYAIDDDVLPNEKVSQELVDEISQTVDEAKLRKVERVHDLQLGVESYQQQVNLTAPTITFPGIEKYEMFYIITDPVYGIIYENCKKEKKVMRHQEIHKFYDATLKRVLEGLNSYNNDVTYGYVTSSLSKEDVRYLQLFAVEIEERLKHHDQIRRWFEQEVDINKKTENQAKMTKLSMEWKRLCKIKAKVQKCQSQSQYRRISSQTGAGTEEYYWMQS
ncbi:hypothetical protein Tco_0904176 [Tanacetum coccineum]